MRLKVGVAVSVAAVVALMIVGSIVIAFPLVAGNGTHVALKAVGPRPHASGSSAKTTVMEVFTGTWCPPCAIVDPSISRMMDEYSPDNFILLMYHLSGSDPYQNAAGNSRASSSWYNITFVPTIIVDGGGAHTDDTLWQIGAYSTRPANYDALRGLIDQEYAPGAPLGVTLATDLSPTTASVVATIHATDVITATNLYARFILYEESLYHMGTNGAPFHRAVVRDLKESPLTISMGQTVTLSQSFTLGGWNKNKLGVAVLIQTNDRIRFPYTAGSPTIYYAFDAEILNAARADFVHSGITVYRDEPATDYTETYEKLLSDGGRHFSTYDVLAPTDTGASDVRGPANGAILANSPMVVWSTGSQGAGATLDSSEQTLLQNYLATTSGNLLISGENIGADIGTSLFYQNVLQANFVADIAGGTALQGVTGDPVSGTWASSALAFAGGSPDLIAARAGGTVAFQYQGTSQAAGIRSDFDSDSRVVYLGANFFEGSDTARRDVLGSVVRWFDAKAPPAVGVQWPNGGETLLPGTSYKLTWTARDVEIPANAVDIYFTRDSSNPTWTLIASGEPNDGVFWWNPPAGVDSPLCKLKIVVRDGQGNAGQDLSDSEFTIGTPIITPFSVTLQPGMNLLSFPITPIGSSITSVLSSIDPWYRAVWTYDPATGAWKTWHRGEPANSLNVLDLKMGFWVEITGTAPQVLTVQGVPPTVTSIGLARGYNLVGFPSAQTGVSVASVKAATGATMIVGFSPSAAPGYTRIMADSDVLSAGNGYYLYVPAAATWTVTY